MPPSSSDPDDIYRENGKKKKVNLFLYRPRGLHEFEAARIFRQSKYGSSKVVCPERFLVLMSVTG
jgi:hypothetical protein